MRWLVLVSLLVHTPFTPLVALLGLLGWLATPPPDGPEAPPLNAIPVDLIEADEPGTPQGGVTPPPAPVPAEPEAALPPPVKSEPKGQLRDAGAPDAREPDAAARDAGARDAGAEVADAADAALADSGEENDAGLADAGPGSGEGGAEPVAAVSGDGRRVIDSNANVRVLIYPEKIRNHPLAPRIGKLLGSIYQWRDFFGPAGLDPIRDVDRVLITGSQLRDSKDVAAILKLNVPAPRIREAVDAIVRTDTEHGAWLDAGLPAATAYADRAPRVFVIGTGGIVIVTPPSALDSVLAHGKKISLKPAEGPAVLTAYAVTPHRVRGLPVRIPESIRYVRLWVTPGANGGATIEAVGEDETAELAAEHAEELQRGLAAAATLDLGVVGDLLGMGKKRLVQKIEVRAEGKKLHASAFVTDAQLDEILGFAEAFLVDRRRPPPKPAGTVAPDAAPAATPPAETGSRRSRPR